MQTYINIYIFNMNHLFHLVQVELFPQKHYCFCCSCHLVRGELLLAHQYLECWGSLVLFTAKMRRKNKRNFGSSPSIQEQLELSRLHLNSPFFLCRTKQGSYEIIDVMIIILLLPRPWGHRSPPPSYRLGVCRSLYGIFITATNLKIIYNIFVDSCNNGWTINPA